MAQSGHRFSTVAIDLAVNRSCVGCAVSASIGGDQFVLSGTSLVLVIVFAIVAVVLVIIIVVMYLRGRERKRQPVDNSRFDSSFDSMEIRPPQRELPPPAYNDIPYHQQHLPLNPGGNNVTTSEMSDQSHSASSGRGSADYNDNDDLDLEINTIE